MSELRTGIDEIAASNRDVIERHGDDYDAWCATQGVETDRARFKRERDEAVATIGRLEHQLSEARSTQRWNVEDGPDGTLYVCRDEHEKGEPCEWEAFVPADRASRALPSTALAARPEKEWHEDHGEVLWWKFPVEEAPYVGSPLCDDWPGYHTHWTPLPPIPSAPSTPPTAGDGHD